MAYIAISLVVLSRHGYLGEGYSLDEQRMLRADSVINNAIAQDDFPGAVLCVVSRARDNESMGRLLYLKAYGNRQVCSGRDTISGKWIADTIAMTTDAVFDLASLSKCVGTTLSFMRLVEDGRVRLSDDVARYIPDFAPWKSEPKHKGEKPEEESITIKHLLTHTSGLPAAIHVPSFMRRYEKYGNPAEMNLRDSLVTYLAHDAARLSRPGERMLYSCLNFITLQAIIERVTGERLDRFARREVFEPMQLENTWYNFLDAAPEYNPSSAIVPTTVQDDGKLLYGEVHDPTARIVNRGVSGNAGLYSTAEDLAVVASMLMNGGVLRVNRDGLQGRVGADRRVRLFSQAAVDTFFTVPAEFTEHGRALGWDISSAYSSSNGDLFTPNRGANHTGYTGTSMAIDLERGIAIILLTNRVHPLDDGAVGRTRAVVSNIVMSALDK